MIAGARYVLVVDDDAVSRAFLGAALDGAHVLFAADAAEATAAARAHAESIGLMLIDRQLPDADGPGLLRRLRECGIGAPAIATSAELDSDTQASLCAAGFAATLRKPASVADVRARVASVLALASVADIPECAPAPQVAPLLDDARALAAIGGDPAALSALRRLLAAELEGLAGELTGGCRADADLDGRLHRLRASCGFCGAAALQAQAAHLQRALRETPASCAAAVDAFLRVCRSTREALAARDASVVARP